MKSKLEVEIFYDDNLLVVEGLNAALAVYDVNDVSEEERKASIFQKAALIRSVALEMARIDPDASGGAFHFARLAKQVRERMSARDRKLFDCMINEFILCKPKL